MISKIIEQHSSIPPSKKSNKNLDGNDANNKKNNQQKDNKLEKVQNYEVETRFYDYLEKQAEQREKDDRKQQRLEEKEKKHKFKDTSFYKKLEEQITKIQTNQSEDDYDEDNFYHNHQKSARNVDNNRIEEMQQKILEKEEDEEQIEQNYLKAKIRDIRNNINLSEQQKEVKIRILLSKGDQQTRVKNILKQHNNKIIRQTKPQGKFEKFDKNMKIFKNLDTYLETKGLIQNMNELNQDQQKQIKKEYAMMQVGESFQEYDKEMGVFMNNMAKQEEDEYFFQSDMLNNIDVLKTARKALQQKKTKQTKQERQMKKFMKQLEKKPEFSETKGNPLSIRGNDNDVFFEKLEKDFASGRFLKELQVEKTHALTDAQMEFLKRQMKIFELENKQGNLGTEEDKEKAQEFQNKANKVISLLLKTSKNIFRKKIKTLQEESQTLEYQKQLMREKRQEALRETLVKKKEEAQKRLEKVKEEQRLERKKKEKEQKIQKKREELGLDTDEELDMTISSVPDSRLDTEELKQEQERKEQEKAKKNQDQKQQQQQPQQQQKLQRQQSQDKKVHIAVDHISEEDEVELHDLKSPTTDAMGKSSQKQVHFKNKYHSHTASQDSFSKAPINPYYKKYKKFHKVIYLEKEQQQQDLDHEYNNYNHHTKSVQIGPFSSLKQSQRNSIINNNNNSVLVEGEKRKKKQSAHFLLPDENNNNINRGNHTPQKNSRSSKRYSQQFQDSSKNKFLDLSHLNNQNQTLRSQSNRSSLNFEAKSQQRSSLNYNHSTQNLVKLEDLKQQQSQRKSVIQRKSYVSAYTGKSKREVLEALGISDTMNRVEIQNRLLNLDDTAPSYKDLAIIQRQENQKIKSKLRFSSENVLQYKQNPNTDQNYLNVPPGSSLLKKESSNQITEEQSCNKLPSLNVLQSQNSISSDIGQSLGAYRKKPSRTFSKLGFQFTEEDSFITQKSFKSTNNLTNSRQSNPAIKKYYKEQQEALKKIIDQAQSENKEFLQEREKLWPQIQQVQKENQEVLDNLKPQSLQSLRYLDKGKSASEMIKNTRSLNKKSMKLAL